MSNVGCELLVVENCFRFSRNMRLPDFHSQAGALPPERHAQNDIFRVVNGGLSVTEAELPSADPIEFSGWLRVAAGYDSRNTYEGNSVGRNFPISGVVTAVAFRERNGNKYKINRALDGVTQMRFSGVITPSTRAIQPIEVTGVHNVGGREHDLWMPRYGWLRTVDMHDRDRLRRMLPN